MNRKVLLCLLAAEAALCIFFAAAGFRSGGVFSSVLAFPFEQIGMGLRLLSLSGGAGNAIAIVIYVVICLLPCAALLVFRRRRPLRAEDGLLGLLTISLFAVLFLMINPGYAAAALHGGMAGYAFVNAVLGGVIYSILCGYLVLRALRLFVDGGTDKLAGYMAVMLGVLGAIFVYLAFGECFSSMLGSFSALRSGNVGSEHLLGASYIFLVLRFAVSALPHILSVMIVFSALDVLSAFRNDRYSTESVDSVKRMSKLCVKALVVTVLSGICLNVLQLLFAASLRVINVAVEIPVLSMAFVLAALLLTRFVSENKQLKDDNDMFI